MKTSGWLLFGILLVASQVGWAKKTTYIATDHRFNFVKLEEVSSSDAIHREMTHPVDIDEVKLREILGSLKISKRGILGKEQGDRTIFNENALNFLAGNLSKAFHTAAVNEEVVFSYLVKDPLIILRNDRLTIASAWVSGHDLHIDFKKFYAKISVDTDKRGGEQRAASLAQGIRVALEAGPGQRLSENNPNEIIIGLDPSANTDSQQVSNEGASPSEKTVEQGSAKERLEKLEELKKAKLITNEEYQHKRKEILNAL